MVDKYFFITIDTEGDNLWDNDNDINTKNVDYLPRFQELSEKYGFKPVWLTNYEMACNDKYVDYMKKKQDLGLCEIGMHLHAWNNPPLYKLEKINNNRDYIIEYPYDIIEKKVEYITNLLAEKFQKQPITHRSGRWVLNEQYLKILYKYGYKVDCSVTPHVSWHKDLGSTGMVGSNYIKYPENTYYIERDMLEVPMTIRRIKCFSGKKCLTLKDVASELKKKFIGYTEWVRPNKKLDINGIMKVIDLCDKKNENIMFMIHSSELMPSGSPNFKTTEDIEKLYEIIEKIFSYVSLKEYKGITLRDYYTYYVGSKGDKNEK